MLEHEQNKSTQILLSHYERVSTRVRDQIIMPRLKYEIIEVGSCYSEILKLFFCYVNKMFTQILLYNTR